MTYNHHTMTTESVIDLPGFNFLLIFYFILIMINCSGNKKLETSGENESDMNPDNEKKENFLKRKRRNKEEKVFT